MINNRLLTICSLLLVSCMAYGCATPAYVKHLDAVMADHSLDKQGHYNYRCTAGAHRGASVDHVENTLAAFLAADSSDKYAFIEFDVQYSEDRKILVFHDKRMFRLYGNVLNIGETPADEIKDITKGKVPTFDQVMDTIKNKKINIEIKSQGDKEEDRQLADEIVADMRARKRVNDVLVTSISSDVVHYVSHTNPDIRTGLVYWLTSSTYLHFDTLTRNLYDKLDETGAVYLILYQANLRNIDELLKLKPKGKTLMFWDFDDTIFIVHKDLSDRLWGTSAVRAFFRNVRFKLGSLFRHF